MVQDELERWATYRLGSALRPIIRSLNSKFGFSWRSLVTTDKVSRSTDRDYVCVILCRKVVSLSRYLGICTGLGHSVFFDQDYFLKLIGNKQ